MARVKAEIRRLGKPSMGFQAYWAEPEGSSRRGPGLVLIHTILGITEHERTIARTLAEMGFTVAVPDLYSHERDQISVEDARDVHRILRTATFDGSFVNGFEKALASLSRQEQERLRKAARVAVYAPDPIVVGDLRWCVNELSGAPTVDPGRLGVIGLSMGGGYAWTLATLDPRVKACVVIYGRPLLPVDNLSRLKGPVLGIYAGEDHRITDAVPAIEEAMSLYGKAFTTAIYPGLQHGFMDAMAKAAYHPKATRDAWKHVFTFLQETVGPLPVDAKGSLASPPMMSYEATGPTAEEIPEEAPEAVPEEEIPASAPESEVAPAPTEVTPEGPIEAGALPEEAARVAPSAEVTAVQAEPPAEAEPTPEQVPEIEPSTSVESVPAPPPDEMMETEVAAPGATDESTSPGEETRPTGPAEAVSAPAPEVISEPEATAEPTPAPAPIAPPHPAPAASDEVSSEDVEALLRSADVSGPPEKPTKLRPVGAPSRKATPVRAPPKATRPPAAKVPPTKVKSSPPPSPPAKTSTKAKPAPPPPAKKEPPTKEKEERKSPKKAVPSKGGTRKAK